MKRLITIASTCFAALACGSAYAETLVVSLSSHRVAITSSFTGQDLVLFGAIVPDAATPITPPESLHYDAVVTVIGPPQTSRTRRKERLLGIWVNVDSRPFIQVPSYLAVQSNRLLRQIASPEELRRLQLGLDNFRLTQRVGPDFADTVPDDPFRSAFIRIEKENGLYREDSNAVTFITPTVLRAEIPLPARVPTGVYRINVKIFNDGKLITQANSAMQIVKSGFEQYVAEAALDYGLLYGLATAMLALVMGWLASILFRRD